MQHRFANEMMQSRLEVQEATLKQLAEELHDNVAQLLGIAKMNVHEAAKRSNEQAQPLLNSSLEMLSEAITEVRSMSHTMNGVFVLKTGLVDSIKKDLTHISNASRINCKFDTTGEAYDIDEERALMLFRIIQEAVANSVKHGSPDTISVILTYETDSIIVTIKDNGKGFNTTHNSSGMGLTNMEERIKLLDGKITVNSVIDEGTQITLSVPATHGEH